MPKIKTSKTLAKRMVITNSGLIKIGKVGMRHNALSRPKNRKQRPSTQTLSTTQLRAVKHLLPYGGL